MQEWVRAFKKALLSDDFSSFYNNLIQELSFENVDFFLSELKKENLDLLFFQEFAPLNLNSEDPCCIKINNILKQEYKIERALQFQYILEIRELEKEIKYPIIFLKGNILSHYLNLDIHKRSCDLDFIVEKKNFHKVISTLEKLGYAKTSNSYAYGEQSMYNKNKRLFLDVHYLLAVSPPVMHVVDISWAHLYKYSDIVVIDETKIWSLSRELIFIHLCLHFAINHNYNDFMCLYEIYRYLQINKELDWSLILSFAKKHNLLLFIRIACSIVSTLNKKIIKEDTMNSILMETKNIKVDKLNDDFIIDNVINNHNFYISHDYIGKLISDTFIKKILFYFGYWKGTLLFHWKSE